MKYPATVFLIVLCTSVLAAGKQGTNLTFEDLDILSRRADRTTEEAISDLQVQCLRDLRDLTENKALHTDLAVNLCAHLIATRIEAACKKRLGELGQTEEIVDLCFRASVPSIE